MTRILTPLILPVIMLAMATGAVWGNAVGWQHGEAAGELAMYEKNFGVANYNLYSFDKPKAEKVASR